jgi:transcription elongation factor Elf1
MTVDHDDIVRCPACGAEEPVRIAYVGQIGSSSHFLRCQFCGAEWSPLDDPDEPDSWIDESDDLMNALGDINNY